MKKKILLLGGSAQQIIAIKAAKKLGYYTILCDYLVDNPGQKYADKFYLASTTNVDEIFKIAKFEKIDGIISYASDPAAPTAAYIAEKLNLISNSYESVSTLCDKSKFRNFLLNNGFNTPKSIASRNTNNITEMISDFKFPLIVKPVDSSGSKGVTVISSKTELLDASKYALKFSRTGKYIIEEYIQKGYPYLIGGDILVVNGEIKIWGLMNCHRDSFVNSLVPVGKSYPINVNPTVYENIQNVLKKIVSLLKFNNGALNVELIVDKNNKIWPIDIGPRSGGNMIPELMNYIFNVNMAEILIKIAMGDKVEVEVNNSEACYASHNIHSSRKGYLKRIDYSKELKQFIIQKVIYKQKGALIEPFENASKVIGILFFKFDTVADMYKYLSDINKHIKVELDEFNQGEE